MRKITLTGGPLDGRTFLTPDRLDRIDHHAAQGHYTTDGVWHAADPDADLGDALARLADANPGLGHTVDAAALAAELASNGLDEFMGRGIPRIVREARIGRRVLIVAKTRKRAVELFTETLIHATDAKRITRANGKEEVRFDTGGFIRPVGLNSRGHRGVSVDVLYADGTNLDLTDLLPCLAASTSAQVIHHEEA